MNPYQYKTWNKNSKPTTMHNTSNKVHFGRFFPYIISWFMLYSFKIYYLKLQWHATIRKGLDKGHLIQRKRSKTYPILLWLLLLMFHWYSKRKKEQIVATILKCCWSRLESLLLPRNIITIPELLQLHEYAIKILNQRSFPL